MPSSSPRKALEANSFSTLVQMVRAGMGVTLIPEMSVAVETGSGTVSVVRFKDPQPSRTIGMVWRKTSPLAGRRSFDPCADKAALPIDGWIWLREGHHQLIRFITAPPNAPGRRGREG